jgi:hypothetical protein
MSDQIKAGLTPHFPEQLVDELLSAYREAKHNFLLGGLRLSAVEGGRFCEAALRMLEHAATGTFTSLNSQINTDGIIRNLSNLPRGNFSDSIRLHLPRAIRVIYDVRNSRDTAHLADGIDPNLQDATLVVSVLDWILAEFVRLYHGVSAAEAQVIIDGLVVRSVPAVQDFNGFLKVLNPKLQVSGYVLLLLYERGTSGATFVELESWVQPSMRANLRRTLRGLVDRDAYVHDDGSRFYLTKSGIKEVEKRALHKML